MPTARSATSCSRSALKVGDTIVAGEQRRHPAGQRPAAQEHPARHPGAQRRAEAGQGRPDRAQRRLVGAARREGRRLRLGQDAVGRDPEDQHRVPRDHRPGGQRRSRERVDRQGGPEPVAGQAAARARRRDEPGRSPARRRRRQDVRRTAPVSPWGQPTKGYKTRNRKATDRFIVQRRKK